MGSRGISRPAAFRAELRAPGRVGPKVQGDVRRAVHLVAGLMHGLRRGCFHSRGMEGEVMSCMIFLMSCQRVWRVWTSTSAACELCVSENKIEKKGKKKKKKKKS